MDEIFTLDSLIRELPINDKNLIQALCTQELPEKTFKVELPSTVDAATLVSIIRLCNEVSLYFDKPVRVVGWSYNKEVEHFLSSCSSQAKNVSFTFLPWYMKGRLH